MARRCGAARISETAVERVKGIEGLVDIESSLKADRPTLDVKLNRTLASDLGISLAQVSETLRPLLAGAEAGT